MKTTGKGHLFILSTIIFAAALISCRGGGGGSAPQDTTPPSVLSTVPADNAVDVAVSATVTAAFTEPVQGSTLTPAGFIVTGPSGTVDGSVVPSGATATFTPASSLASGTTYTAKITTAVRDLAGNSLTGAYVWRFTTLSASAQDTTAPTVVSTAPANGAVQVPVRSVVTAVFSEAVDAATLTTSTFTLRGPAGAVSGLVSKTSTSAEFAPSGSLAYGTSYTATITTGARDLAGNALSADHVWSFTTEAQPVPKYTIGGTVTGLSGSGLVLRNNGGSDLAVSGNGSFAFSAALASGSTYSVTVLTQPANPGQICTVLRNGSGTVSGANVTGVVIDCTSSRFAYAVNDQDGTLSIYAVDAASGRLRHNGYLPVGGNNPRAVAADPMNRFVFVSNHAGSQAIRTFAVNAATGAVSPSSTLPADIAYSMVVHPSGSYLFAAGSSGAQTVLAYRIDPASGALTAAPGSPYTAGSDPMAVAIHPSGAFLYAANSGSDNVSAFTINAGNGSLVSAGTATAGAFPLDLAVEPSGRFLYVVNGNDGTVSAYAINGTTGGLTEVAGSPFSTGFTDANSLAVSPTGRFVYVTTISGLVAVLGINPDTGALSEITGSPYAAGTWPADVEVDAAGTNVYVLNSGSHDLSMFAADPVGGTLTFRGKISTRKAPYRLAQSRGAAPVTVKPKFAYTANNSANTVSIYAIDASGALTSAGTATAGTNPSSVTVDPAGRFAYVTNAFNGAGGNSVSAFAIDGAMGALTSIGTTTTGTSPASAAVDPSGRFLYVANGGSASISGYEINAGNGSLTPLAGSPYASTGTPMAVTVDAAGRFVYAATGMFGKVSAYHLNPASGVLTPVAGSPFTSAPVDAVSLAEDPMGRRLYTTDSGGQVQGHIITPDTGVLVGPIIEFGDGSTIPSSVTVDPYGRFAYVVNNIGLGGILGFAIGLTDGGLTPLTGSPFPTDFRPGFAVADPSGKYLYALQGNTTAAYRITETTGAVTSIGPAVAAGSGARWIAVAGAME